jgi:hypothetical protein
MLNQFTVLLLDFSIVCLSITCILQAWWLSKLASRVTQLEHATFLRDWLKVIEDGESMSDMAYMKEKGFLK